MTFVVKKKINKRHASNEIMRYKKLAISVSDYGNEIPLPDIS